MNNLGPIGEQLAKDYLKAKGWNFLEQNFRTKHGEIDLVFSFEDEIIFVEVKTRKAGNLVSAPADISQSKLERLEAAAAEWVEANKSEEYRFLLVLVEVYDNGVMKIKEVEL